MIKKIAYYLERNDEAPNIELAQELVKKNHRAGIKELVAGLRDERPLVVGDCIKVLYEIGKINPSLISDHIEVFIELLQSKNKRLVWGSMIALSNIAALKPREIYDHLETVIAAYHKGSVITIDHSISVFAELAKANPKYHKRCFPIIISHLEKCRPKEIPQHAERAFICLTKNNAAEFRNVLQKRRNLLTEPQRKRVDKLLMKISGGGMNERQTSNSQGTGNGATTTR